MSTSTIKDFNQVRNINWIRPPIISNIIGFPTLMQVLGLVKRRNKTEFVNEVCFGYEPIDYLNGKVVHWNNDCSKGFMFVNGKNIEVSI
jgi:hypothetical protein